MNCHKCGELLDSSVTNYDYTKLAGLPGKTVTLVDVEVRQCCKCDETSVELWRMADLHRELEAARVLKLANLRLRYESEDGWVVLIDATPAKQRANSVGRRRDALRGALAELLDKRLGAILEPYADAAIDERVDLIEEIIKLAAKWSPSPKWLDEALNSGDGTYKP